MLYIEGVIASKNDIVQDYSRRRENFLDKINKKKENLGALKEDLKRLEQSIKQMQLQSEEMEAKGEKNRQ